MIPVLKSGCGGGEDDAYECLTDILDNAGIAPEERAKMLTEQDKA